jgi:hypothetical protein
MSVIAPVIFGDFQSPGAVSYTQKWSGTMPPGAGFDAAVSTMLNGFVQQDLLPTGGALVAEEFGVGSSPDSAYESDTAPQSSNGSDLSASVPTATVDLVEPAIDAGGIEPICREDQLADKLQHGGEYWNQVAGLGGPRLKVSRRRPLARSARTLWRLEDRLSASTDGLRAAFSGGFSSSWPAITTTNT